jgi:hypothetical protein
MNKWIKLLLSKRQYVTWQERCRLLIVFKLVSFDGFETSVGVIDFREQLIGIETG